MDKNGKKPSDHLAELILQMRFGEAIAHAEIEKIIGVARGEKRYYGIVAQAKRRLMEAGYFLEAVRGDGYRIIPPDEVTAVAVKHYVRGGRQISRGNKMLTYAPTEAMSVEGRRTYDEVAEKAQRLNAGVAGTVTELSLLTRRRHPFTLALEKE